MTPVILDVTLRDGGYVNNHEFDISQAKYIVSGLSRANVPNIEVGYFRPWLAEDPERPATRCPIDYLRGLSDCAGHSSLVVMMHPRQASPGNYEKLVDAGVSLVRLALKPDDVEILDTHLRAIHRCGLKCSVNLIRVSELPLDLILSTAARLERMGADVFYIADSNGSLLPDGVSLIIKGLASVLKIPVGFHAHDGLRLAFANTLAAIEGGATYIDSSLGGMGKSGGNLVTELIAIYLNKRYGATYGISGLGNLSENQLAKWIGPGGVAKCEHAMAAVLNWNIDNIAASKEAAVREQRPFITAIEAQLSKSAGAAAVTNVGG